MLTRTSTPSRKQFHTLNSVENRSRSLQSKKKSIGIQTDLLGTCLKSINTPSYLNNILMQGKNMDDTEFEEFIKVNASDCYWKILAERARDKLDHQLQENRQLHELLDELTKENEQLQTKNEQCEYLTNIFNSIISEYDSGIELNITEESPASKRQKMHV